MRLVDTWSRNAASCSTNTSVGVSRSTACSTSSRASTSMKFRGSSQIRGRQVPRSSERAELLLLTVGPAPDAPFLAVRAEPERVVGAGAVAGAASTPHPVENPAGKRRAHRLVQGHVDLVGRPPWKRAAHARRPVRRALALVDGETRPPPDRAARRPRTRTDPRRCRPRHT